MKKRDFHTTKIQIEREWANHSTSQSRASLAYAVTERGTELSKAYFVAGGAEIEPFVSSNPLRLTEKRRLDGS